MCIRDRVNASTFTARFQHDLDGELLDPTGAFLDGFVDFQRWDAAGYPAGHVVEGVVVDGPSNASTYCYRVACVDLSKRENILVAAGGGPALMDFQAGWRLRPGSWAGWLFGPLLRTLQRGDRYHVYKHQRRRFPTAPIPPAPADLRSTPWGVRLHGWLLRKPYLAIKRLFDGKAHA